MSNSNSVGSLGRSVGSLDGTSIGIPSISFSQKSVVK